MPEKVILRPAVQRPPRGSTYRTVLYLVTMVDNQELYHFVVHVVYTGTYYEVLPMQVHLPFCQDNLTRSVLRTCGTAQDPEILRIVAEDKGLD